MSDAPKPSHRGLPTPASTGASAPTLSTLAAKSGPTTNPITVYVGGLGPRAGTALVAVLVLYLLGAFVMPALATGFRAVREALPHEPDATPTVATALPAPITLSAASTTMPTSVPTSTSSSRPAASGVTLPAPRPACPGVPSATAASLTVIAPEGVTVTIIHDDWRCPIMPNERVTVPAGALLIRYAKHGRPTRQQTATIERGGEMMLNLEAEGS